MARHSSAAEPLCYNPEFRVQIFLYHDLGSGLFEEMRPRLGSLRPACLDLDLLWWQVFVYVNDLRFEVSSPRLTGCKCHREFRAHYH